MGIEREPLSVRGGGRVNLGECGPGERGEREVAGHVLRDAGEVPRRQRVARGNGAACVEPGAAPDDAERPVCLRRALHRVAYRRDGLERRHGHVAVGRAAGAMCHSRHECTGITLPGFARRSGSNTSRSAHIVASESGEKMRSMYRTLSRPIPCSPVIVPPAATHTLMISCIASCTRATSSASAALYVMLGCRLPSPAWNTLQMFTRRSLPMR